MNQAIADFIQAKRYAIVGLSRSGKKFGNIVYTELKQRGYQVVAVHPSAEEINGVTCYPNLSAVSEQVDGVIVCVPPAQAVQVVRDAAAAGIRKIWLQQGAQSPEVLAVADELKLTPVTGKCILMYAGPVTSFHAFHRGFARLFGQL